MLRSDGIRLFRPYPGGDGPCCLPFSLRCLGGRQVDVAAGLITWMHLKRQLIHEFGEQAGRRQRGTACHQWAVVEVILVAACFDRAAVHPQAVRAEKSQLKR